jgi:transposase
MAQVVGHLSVEDLEAEFRSARDPTAARHFQVIWLLARGHTIADVAAVTSFVPRWIEQLLARYNAHGPDALGDLRRRNGSAPSVLRPELLARLPERLATPPSDGGLWTGPKVAAWMAGELGLAAVLPPRGWEALKAIGWSVQKPRPRHPASATPEEREAFKKKLEQGVAEERAKHPDTPVEVWATDEHRIGLKPILRRVWAPKGQRPIALGHHRYKWLSVTAFVQPISGEVFWYVSNGISKPFFAALLALFAREAGAGRERIIVLGLDNAGWHTAPNLAVPEGIRLVYLPRYSPELQPAEHLWPVLDEPLANRYFETLADLEQVVTERCRTHNGDQLKPGTTFHWWPKPARPS